MTNPIEQTTKDLVLEYDTGRIFSVVAHDVNEGSVLKYTWQLNWDNLGLWQGSTGIPTSSIFEEEYKSPYDRTTI